MVVTAERRTIFEIEREAHWRIWLLFAVLVALVFVAAWVACLIVAVAFSVSFPVVDSVSWVFDPLSIAVILVVSVGAALLYWAVSQVGAAGRLLKAMHCKPLDPADRYHQRLANIAEEMRLATGGPNVTCVTIATLGLNAFAFSDLHGGCVVGVTEGALARLSRQQLQAVVADEFAQVLSGAYVTVTVSCMLFGIYSSLGESLEDATMAAVPTQAMPIAPLALLLRGWLWVLQVASSVTSSALNRERERQADVAAARYTRDPLSLAEALRVISRHPGGAGYIPEGLAPLCIRAVEPAHRRGLGGWHARRPALGERIDRLVALANVSPDEFVRQADAAGDVFAKREHWHEPPAGGARPLTTEPLGVAPPRPPAPSSAHAGGSMACPGCGASLREADYEGLRIHVCAACGGRLASSQQVSRILARRDVGFSEEQRHLAGLIVATGDQRRRAARLARGAPGVKLVGCPRCGRSMMRAHYSYEHAVEVDRCVICDLIWFEKDELEALQLIVEQQADRA